MNTKKQKTKNMGFFRINSIWMAIAIIAVTVGITIAVTYKGSSKTTNNLNTESSLETSSSVMHLTDADFSTAISSGVVLVDYWAAWCMPCRMQGPTIDKIALEMGSSAKICKMDVDKNPATSAKYNIVSIPTIMIFNNGKLVETFVGLQQKETLDAALNKYIKK